MHEPGAHRSDPMSNFKPPQRSRGRYGDKHTIRLSVD